MPSPSLRRERSDEGRKLLAAALGSAAPTGPVATRAGPSKLAAHLRTRVVAFLDHHDAGIALARIGSCSRADRDWSEAAASQRCESAGWVAPPAMGSAHRLFIGAGPAMRPQRVAKTRAIGATAAQRHVSDGRVVGQLVWDPPPQRPGVDDQIIEYQAQIRYTRFQPTPHLTAAMARQAKSRGTSWTDLETTRRPMVRLQSGTPSGLPSTFLGDVVVGSEQYRVRARNARGWGPWSRG